MISMATGPIAPIAIRPSDRDRTTGAAAGGAACTCVLRAGSTGGGDIRGGSNEDVALTSEPLVTLGGAGNSIFTFDCGASTASFSDRVSTSRFGGASPASFSNRVSTGSFGDGASTASFGGVAEGSAAASGCTGGCSTATFSGGATIFGGAPTATFLGAGGGGGSVTFGGGVGNSIGFP